MRTEEERLLVLENHGKMSVAIKAIHQKVMNDFTGRNFMTIKRRYQHKIRDAVMLYRPDLGGVNFANKYASEILDQWMNDACGGICHSNTWGKL